jgi:6-phosphogluconolactonase
MNKITIFDCPSEMNKAVIEFIDNLLQTKESISISLSGGTTPKALFDDWATLKQSSDYWKKINLFWSDERCVPPDDAMSNYGMTKMHLLNKVPIPETNVFRIFGEANPETEAERYSQLIDMKATPFDLILLGLGDDGHTVSIFPPTINLWESEQTCIVNSHPESGMQRVTITGKVINGASHVMFLVTGRSKAKKASDILLHGKHVTDIYPAARVNPTSGSLFWFLDKEAATLL